MLNFFQSESWTRSEDIIQEVEESEVPSTRPVSVASSTNARSSKKREKTSGVGVYNG